MLKFLTNLFFLIATILLLSFQQLAYALPWDLEASLKKHVEYKPIKKQINEITTPEDLELLLKNIAKKAPFTKLEAHLKEEKWVITGTVAPALKQVHYVLATSTLISELEGHSQKFEGKPDSPLIRKSILEMTRESLIRSGYPTPKIKIEVDPGENNSFSYVVTVEEGPSCFIKKIEFSFKIPKGASLQIKPGDICDLNVISNAFDKLTDDIRGLGFNQLYLETPQITYSKNKTRGTLKIMGSLGQRYSYKIIDTKSYFVTDDLFTYDEYSGLDPSIISPEAMASELIKRLRNQGFIDAKIIGQSHKQLSANEIQYTIKVNIGTRYFLKEIDFEGVRAFDEKKLLDEIALDTSWSGSEPFNPEKITKSKEIIEALYQKSGYWNVKIKEPRISKNKHRQQISVTISVREGLIRLFDKITLSGIHFFTKNTITNMIDIKRNQPLDRSILLDFQDKIQSAYIEEGFLYSKVNLSIKSVKRRKSQYVTIQIFVEEGPRVKINNIHIIGLNKTHKKVVQRELMFKEGDLYKPEIINKTRKALVSLGIFRYVQIIPNDRSAFLRKSPQLDLLIKLKESKPGTVIFGPGYDLYKGFSYSVESSYNNLNGLGRQVSLRAALSEELQQEAINDKTLLGRKIGAGYIEPYILDLPVDGKITYSHKATADAYWKFSHTGEISLIHKLKKISAGSSISLFYGQKVSRQEGKEGQIQTGLISSTTRMGRSGLRLTIDTRNSQAWPTGGSLFLSEVSWARYYLGGNLKYFHWSLTNNHYFKLKDRLVAAIGLSLSSYHGVDKEDQTLAILPESERLFVGGSNMVRGFENQLGPYIRRPVIDEESGEITHYENDIVGGDRRVYVKSELRYLTWESVGMSLFVDGGNTFLASEQAQNFQHKIDQLNAETGADARLEDNFEYTPTDFINEPKIFIQNNYFSYGLSCNILTPIGAINIAYAWPWKEPKSEDCKKDKVYCHERAKPGDQLYYRGRLELNVGAKF